MKYIILLLFIFIGSQSFSQEAGFQSTGFEDEVKNEVKVYPNPCKNDKVTIEFSSKEISEVRLTNIAGQQVLLKKYDFPLPKIQLRLNEVPNGIYLLQITTTDNKPTVKKLMISRN
ncbi:T9SS type A sorting domain-containing protein [Draconibacterium sp. IB214405]|uniref:T9SS type A sorting domain-containing protein n=1 Tax=Draconibacterium sp. IB214405 TaxID=3097352 RepID=UPI002A0AEE91|nr:T9SS type A sorting domain-containing protein [Draconibacterium sp. IB214405]MDX8338529.1 T9SS type A sorting domain-containing protein [Draconibacterium sp. IB214405]